MAERRAADVGGADDEHARERRPWRVPALIGAVGMVLTCSSAWAAFRVDRNTEQRLLEMQTRQVGAVLSGTIDGIQAPLRTALTVQSVAGAADPKAFEKAMAASVGPDKVFVSASIWQRRAGRLVQIASVGSPAAAGPDDATAQAYLRAAFHEPTSTVKAVNVGTRRRIAYALADPDSAYVVHAERAIPVNRRSPVDSNPAFADLHYAIYLGPQTRLAAMTTTNVAPSTLPLEGRTATTVVPFGDNVLTVVTSPRHGLGSSLSQRLPVLLLIGGTLLTVVAAFTAQQLVRRRQRAENDAATVSGLYDQVEALYGQQRELSERLQRALLPPALPDIPQLEVAVDYIAGTRGVDIGGDWYGLIDLDQSHFAFIVGDVSGRGVDAVAVMAAARFTLRAYLLRGDTAATALGECSRQFDSSADGHIATAIVGIGNWRTGEVTVANAGHFPPLLLTADSTQYVDVATGPPLGTGVTDYPSTTFTMPPGSTLTCFTDGLIERRTEDIDTGMRRLADTVAESTHLPVADLVTHAVRTLRSEDAEDDIAVLALRRATAG